MPTDNPVRVALWQLWEWYIHCPFAAAVENTWNWRGHHPPTEGSLERLAVTESVFWHDFKDTIVPLTAV